MSVLLVILAIMITPIFIALIRTVLLEKKTAAFTPSANPRRIEDCSEKLSEMIRVETVSHRDDPEVEKFRSFHRTLERLFPTVFEKMEKIEIDGNLLMRWPGTTPSLAPIILISHMDVVPAEGEWTHPPFSGTITEGRIWGRGAVDIKENLMCLFQAAEELLKEGYVPACDVYLGSSCTEEIGGDGAPKLVNWFRERGIRLFMLCDEGGAIVENPVAGVSGPFANIGIFEKGYGSLKFKAYSTGGHASMPPKNTPIARLAKFEADVEAHDPFKIQSCPTMERMFAELAPYCHGFGQKMVMGNLWLFRPFIRVLLPNLSSMLAAMLKTTVAFTMQKGSEADNVIPREAWVVANLRYIPHQKMDESNMILRRMAAKYNIETEVIRASDPSAPIDLNGEAYRMTVAAVNKVFPGIGVIPCVHAGGTDAKFYGDICDNCVRFAPIIVKPDQLSGQHGINENIEGAVLPYAVDYFKEIIRLQEQRKQ